MSDSKFNFYAFFIVEAEDIPQARKIAHAFLTSGITHMQEAGCGWNGERITVQGVGPGGTGRGVPQSSNAGSGQLTPEQRLAYFRSKTL